jgi:hypothetical protein
MFTPPQIEYRRLGKSGLRVSGEALTPLPVFMDLIISLDTVPILGCMSFGTDKYAPWIVNEQEVRHIDRIHGVPDLTSRRVSPY